MTTTPRSFFPYCISTFFVGECTCRAPCSSTQAHTHTRTHARHAHPNGTPDRPCPPRAQEVYTGLDGSARDPLASPHPDMALTRGEVEDEIRREAAVGEGRRAVAVLLQKMLSTARFGSRCASYAICWSCVLLSFFSSLPALSLSYLLLQNTALPFVALFSWHGRPSSSRCHGAPPDVTGSSDSASWLPLRSCTSIRHRIAVDIFMHFSRSTPPAAALLLTPCFFFRHETEVVACLHAACRATTAATPHPADSCSGSGGGGKRVSQASSSSLKQRQQQPRAGRLFDAAGGAAASSAGAASRGRAGGRDGTGERRGGGSAAVWVMRCWVTFSRCSQRMFD